MSTRRQAVLALLAANLLFAGSFPFAVVGLRGWSVLTLTGLRFVVAGAVLARVGVPLLRRSTWARRRHIAALACFGLWAQMTFLYFGIEASQAAIAAVIVGLEPVLIAAWAAVVLHERFTRTRAAGLSLGLLGALLVAGVGTGSAHILGLLCLIGMGLTWSWYTVAGKALMQELTPVELISGVSVCGALWAVWPALISVVWFGGWSDPGGEQWVALLYLGVAQSVVGYLLWNRGLNTLPAALVGTSLYIQPILGAAFSWLFLQETLPATFIPGTAMVLAAVWVAGRPAREPEVEELEHHPEAVAAGVTGSGQPPVA